MKPESPDRLILGSASPRRRSLISLLLYPDEVTVVAPTCDELSFDDVHDRESIQQRIEANVRLKVESVLELTEPEPGPLLCADTIVVAEDATGSLRCLGKPPEDNWRDVVTGWFREYYCQRPHRVQTCFALRTQAGCHMETVTTEIVFRADACDWLPWYLETEEPRGKAGGYGIQGAGSVFAEQIRGSFSNVVGLPLERLMVALQDAGFELSGHHDER